MPHASYRSASFKDNRRAHYDEFHQVRDMYAWYKKLLQSAIIEEIVWKRLKKDLWSKGQEIFGRNVCLIAIVLSGLKTSIQVLEDGESRGESGFTLDGFPQTIRKAEILDSVTDIDLVVNLKLREDVLIEKCLGRRTCSECGKDFNVASINVKANNGLPAMIMPPLSSPPNFVE
nr:adenylate kinase [Tanacetum cinerariifolium]